MRVLFGKESITVTKMKSGEEGRDLDLDRLSKAVAEGCKSNKNNFEIGESPAAGDKLSDEMKGYLKSHSDFLTKKSMTGSVTLKELAELRALETLYTQATKGFDSLAAKSAEKGQLPVQVSRSMHTQLIKQEKLDVPVADSFGNRNGERAAPLKSELRSGQPAFTV